MKQAPNTNLDQIKNDPSEKIKKISGWKDYYKKQKVIVTLTNDTVEEEKRFNKECDDINENPQNVSFIVLAPITFLHLHDFKEKVEIATTFFCFMKNGHVITEERTGLSTINFTKAFNAIVKRVTGTDPSAIVPEVPLTDLLSLEQESKLQEKLDKFGENLELWMEKFNILPAVRRASLFIGDRPGWLVEISIKSDFPGNDSCDDFILCIGNEVVNPDWDPVGEESALYKKWFNELKLSSYENLYKSLVELSNQYVCIPQA